MRFEEGCYENADLRAIKNVSAADRQRIAKFAYKSPLDVSCGKDFF